MAVGTSSVADLLAARFQYLSIGNPVASKSHELPNRALGESITRRLSGVSRTAFPSHPPADLATALKARRSGR